MDYEKVYNEALKRAIAAIDIAADKDLVKGVATTIFPQLRESEDERIRKELKEAFEAYDIESKWNGIPIRSIFAWLEKQKEQEPADLSEMMVHKEPYIAPVPTPMVADEQKPEWIEEDEDMLNSCISSIEEAKENRYAYKETDGDTSYDHEIAWLKSLRPSWKPSEEQMEALKRASMNEYLSAKQFDILVSLYEQLKNLM